MNPSKELKPPEGDSSTGLGCRLRTRNAFSPQQDSASYFHKKARPQHDRIEEQEIHRNVQEDPRREQLAFRVDPKISPGRVFLVDGEEAAGPLPFVLMVLGRSVRLEVGIDVAIPEERRERYRRQRQREGDEQSLWIRPKLEHSVKVYLGVPLGTSTRGRWD